ncbi:MAG: hypothetical protein KY475_22815 [Planctomycetes bacterium]|nr:hypothetical protein [Planctomycetota bacterium]
MATVYFDRRDSDDLRRQRLYDGHLYVYSPQSSTSALCDFARDMCEEAFAPHDPRDAQHVLPVEQFVAILAELKPRFIHHPRSKELIREILAELGCDLQQTYFDVPRMRTAASGDYLRAGLGYQFKPHRDVWYSPPLCQLNWWLPVYPIEAENAMAFHLNYWDRAVENTSHEFNYQEWNETGRKAAPGLIKADTRRQSEAIEPLELEPDVRLLPEPGGMIIFSAAQLHSTVPNTSGRTRISLDFRTVHLGDLAERRGAPNLDSRCSGTTIGDNLRGTDFSHVPDEVAEMHQNAALV